MITQVGSNSQDKRATSAAEDGSYCFELPVGEYIVKPVVSYKSKKLNVVPQERKVKIFDEPEFHIDFTREKLVVKGSIIVQNNIDSSVLSKTKIVLKNQNGEV
jgi:hypothetical protein